MSIFTFFFFTKRHQKTPFSGAPKRPAFVVCMIIRDMGREELERKREIENILVTLQRVKNKGGRR